MKRFLWSVGIALIQTLVVWRFGESVFLATLAAASLSLLALFSSVDIPVDASAASVAIMVACFAGIVAIIVPTLSIKAVVGILWLSPLGFGVGPLWRKWRQRREEGVVSG